MSPGTKRKLWFIARYAVAMPLAAWLGWNMGGWITSDFDSVQWRFAPQALAVIPAVLLVTNRRKITASGRRFARGAIIMRKHRRFI